VARIWREWNLQPWRRETFKFSGGVRAFRIPLPLPVSVRQ
jgi:hypothetical protein